MIEIIPNWHPVFVHYTVALLSLAVVFHMLCRFISEGKLKKQFGTLADWNLWLGTGFGVITAIAGWMAANSVVHDAPSHAAMMDHRNWALSSVALFMILSGYSLFRVRKGGRPGVIFLGALLLAGIMLGGTAWRGAEVVYRHGVGVMSLPQSEAGEHDHASHDNSAQATDDDHTNASPELEATSHQVDDTPEHAATGGEHSEEGAAEHNDHEDHVH